MANEDPAPSTFQPSPSPADDTRTGSGLDNYSPLGVPTRDYTLSPEFQRQRQAPNQPFFNPLKTRPWREWGKPDFVLNSFNKYPGMPPPSPLFPQPNQVNGLIQQISKGLGGIGSPKVAALAMLLGGARGNMVQNYIKGMQLRAQMERDNYEDIAERTAATQVKEFEEIQEIFSEFDENKDHDALQNALVDWAKRNGDQRIERLAHAGNFDAIHKVLNTRDQYSSALQKLNAGRKKVAAEQAGAGTFNDAQRAAAIQWLDSGQKPSSRDRKWNEGVYNALIAIGKERGMSPEETMHQVGQATTEFPARVSASRYWLGGGKGAQGTQRLDVAANHMQVLEELAGQLGNIGSPTWNALANYYKTLTGQEAPTTFEGVKSLIGGEISTAALGGVGALKDREELRTALNAANSPAQMAGVITGFKRLLLGQIDARKQMYERETGRTDFEKMLEPQTLDYLRSGRPANIGATPTPAPAAPGAPASPSAHPTPTPASVQKLREHPELRAKFDEMFGAGAAEKVLGPASAR